MADSTMFNVKENFDLNLFVKKLSETYKAKSYQVNVIELNGMTSITFEKNTDGVQNILGMSEKITANINYSNNVLSINYVDADWTMKIIACAVGWFLCLIPLITGVIGCSKQLSLPKNINRDAQMIVSGM